MENLKVLRRLDELQELEDYIKANEFIAFDTETTGLSKDANIIGFSVSADVETGYYVVLYEWNVAENKLIELETKSRASAMLELLVGKSLIMHNGLFDCQMVDNNYGIKLIDYLHTDSMILSHLLDENRGNGLKDLGVSIFGEDAKDEQKAMKESVHKNGGLLTKDCYELYKADSELLGKYGAKDAVLTIKLFYHLVPQLYEQKLEDFFYNDESMPLLKGPTYELNTVGLKVDTKQLALLKVQLEVECMEAKAFIHKEIQNLVKEDYPGTKPSNTFNIGSSKQLAWLLFFKLDNDYSVLTKEGREVCKALGLKIPYSPSARRDFIYTCTQSKGNVYQEEGYSHKTKKKTRPKKVGNAWNYIACSKDVLGKLAHKYKWVEKLLEYNKNLKLLNTYVIGILERARYNVIHPSFLQHGTTSGRYSSRNPNFQNLPRDDKRIKSCIIARPGMVFVGADYSQLEPRVFASFSGDERLLACFNSGDDFYSTIGVEVFDKQHCSLKKDDPNSFAKQHPELRNIAKVVALSATYGTTPPKMAPTIGKRIEEAREIIENYFERFPKVKTLMLDSHELIKKDGQVFNLFGRPRRMPQAKLIPELFKGLEHSELSYEYRKFLNLAVNHRIQSTGASIMNRAAIQVYTMCKEMAVQDFKWNDVKVVLQVHDELVLEGPEELGDCMVIVLKEAMEHTVELPGVDLVAEPKIGHNLAELK